MEGDFKKNIIVEFNGLPGCGKTTICKHLFNLFSKEGGIKPYYPIRDRMSQINFLLVSLFNLRNVKFLLSLILFSIKVKPLRNRMKAIRMVVMYCGMYDFFNKKYNYSVMLVDQGVLQGLLSILHTDFIGDGSVIKKSIKNFFKKDNIFIVNCNCPITISKQRITARGSRLGRLDCMEETEMSESLRVQQDNIKILRRTLDDRDVKSITVETDEKPEQNAEKILFWLKTFMEYN